MSSALHHFVSQCPPPLPACLAPTSVERTPIVISTVEGRREKIRYHTKPGPGATKLIYFFSIDCSSLFSIIVLIRFPVVGSFFPQETRLSNSYDEQSNMETSFFGDILDILRVSKHFLDILSLSLPRLLSNVLYSRTGVDLNSKKDTTIPGVAST